MWLPTGLPHRVGALLGAEFRSLWSADEAGAGLPENPTVFSISPLPQALIVEAAAIEGQEDPDGYASRVTSLILNQLRRARSLPDALPWSRSGTLLKMCEAIYADPVDPRGPDEWGGELGMSGQTLARRWRRRLRLFKATELLGGGLRGTRTAMELAYGSTSAFVYAFRTDTGCGPQTYMRGRSVDRRILAASHAEDVLP